jgi:hypothetical protein
MKSEARISKSESPILTLSQSANKNSRFRLHKGLVDRPIADAIGAAQEILD